VWNKNYVLQAIWQQSWSTYPEHFDWNMDKDFAVTSCKNTASGFRLFIIRQTSFVRSERFLSSRPSTFHDKTVKFGFVSSASTWLCVSEMSVYSQTVSNVLKTVIVTLKAWHQFLKACTHVSTCMVLSWDNYSAMSWKHGLILVDKASHCPPIGQVIFWWATENRYVYVMAHCTTGFQFFLFLPCSVVWNYKACTTTVE